MSAPLCSLFTSCVFYFNFTARCLLNLAIFCLSFPGYLFYTAELFFYLVFLEFHSDSRFSSLCHFMLIIVVQFVLLEFYVGDSGFLASCSLVAFVMPWCFLFMSMSCSWNRICRSLGITDAIHLGPETAMLGQVV